MIWFSLISIRPGRLRAVFENFSSCDENPLGNRVKSPWMKRVASKYPFSGKHESFGRTVTLNRLIRIFGTTRWKPAGGPQHRRNRILISSYEDKKRFFPDHNASLTLWNKSSIEMNSSSDANAAASFFAMTLISRPLRIFFWFFRKYSRVLRFIRFLMTALPTRLVVVMPRRASDRWLGAKQAMKYLFCTFLPNVDVWINSDRFLNLLALV